MPSFCATSVNEPGESSEFARADRDCWVCAVAAKMLGVRQIKRQAPGSAEIVLRTAAVERSEHPNRTRIVRRRITVLRCPYLPRRSRCGRWPELESLLSIRWAIEFRVCQPCLRHPDRNASANRSWKHNFHL